MPINRRDDIILLSIESRFMEEIFSGEKEYEFRKPSLPKDLSYVVLVENESREIMGGFQPGEIEEREIDKLWAEFGMETSNKERFYDYFDGWNTGLAIKVNELDEFESPVPLKDIVQKDVSLNVPQQFSFVYLTRKAIDILANQSEILDSLILNSTLDEWVNDQGFQQDGRLNIRPILESEIDQFRELFAQSPVPSDYEEIDASFLDHIIEAHTQGKDPYGYFTKRKKVYTFLKDEDPVGFTVTTWKRGGSVKYGPTIMAENQRGEGLGPKFRRKLDEMLKEEGVRKTYSTIPENHTKALRYLIKSDYAIEGHMKRQYNEEHSELVFGKLLRPVSAPSTIRQHREVIEDLDHQIGSDSFPRFSNFVIDTMNPWYDEIDSDFVNAVKEAEQRSISGNFSKKGKRVYVGHTSVGIRCTIIASKKRGGAVKISPFLSKVSGDPLNQFLEFVESDLRQFEGVRKFYTHVPIFDADLLSVFRQSGYQPEGLLKEPYKEGIDMVFMGKMVV